MTTIWRAAALSILIAFIAFIVPTRSVTAQSVCAPRLFAPRQFEFDPLVHGRPADVVAHDLNGDGHPDLVVPARKVDVFLGRGDGWFEAPAVYELDGQAYRAAVGDFTGDGHPDIAVLDGRDGAGILNVLLNRGDGSFVRGPSRHVPFDASRLAWADLDGDGDVDLALRDERTVFILLSAGDGHFVTGVVAPVPNLVRTLAIADVDGDGDPDVVVAGTTEESVGTLEVLRNRGDATFAPAVTFPADARARSIEVADMNGDGLPDAVFTGHVDRAIHVHLNDGEGGFGGSTRYPVEDKHDLVLTDLDGDGDRDVVVTDLSHSVVVLLNDGQGGLSPPTLFAAGLEPERITAADFDGDGAMDVAVTNEDSENLAVTILPGRGDGTLAAPSHYAAPWTGRMQTEDVNADGHADLIMTFPYEDNVGVAFGDGNGAFGFFIGYPTGREPRAVSVADFDEDDDLDLAVAYTDGGNVSILLNRGEGVFDEAERVLVSGLARAIDVGDLDADGHVDLVVTSWSTDWVSVVFGRGDGTFGDRLQFDVGDLPVAVEVGDLNGDGAVDVAVGNFTSSTVSILINEGTGILAAAVDYSTGSQSGSTQHLALGDLDGDGDLDVAAAHSHTRRERTHAAVLLNHGDGTFADAVYYLAGDGMGSIAVGDVDGDGRLDLMTSSGDSIHVHRGRGDGTFRPARAFGAPGVGVGALDDIDEDGDLDLVGPGQTGVWLYFNERCRFGDLDGDGTIGLGDLLVILEKWGPCPDPDECQPDLNGDGMVGLDDVIIVLSAWD